MLVMTTNYISSKLTHLSFIPLLWETKVDEITAKFEWKGWAWALVFVPRFSLSAQNVKGRWLRRWTSFLFLPLPTCLTPKPLFQVIWGSTMGKNSSSPPLSPTWTGPPRSTSWPARRPRNRWRQHLAGTVPHIPALLPGVWSMPARAHCANQPSTAPVS